MTSTKIGTTGQSPNASDQLVLESSGTASGSLTHARRLNPTAAGSVAPPVIGRYHELTKQVADHRDKVQLLTSDAHDLHEEIQAINLKDLAQQKAMKSVASLLDELAVDRGMSWTNVARLVGVSVGAVRKWRKDGSATGENRLALGRLTAFLDLLESYAIEDPVGWLEVPIVDGFTVTAIDLYKERLEFDLLDVAAHRINRSDLLDKHHPDWREKYRTGFEVFKADDGELAIRPK